MPHPNFDDLARDLAAGTSRWRALRSFLAATAGGTAIIGALSARRRARAQETYHVYLPLIKNGQDLDICPVASTCGANQYCSDDETCRCIRSAEGPIRCGNVPSCDIRQCTTSADCADLGEGYFCDTPNSGCCDDSEQQRCIAPCGTDYTCPPERVCGSTCCGTNQSCFEGTCVGNIVGTWDGTTTYKGTSRGVRFVFMINNNDLTGHIYVVDPIENTLVDGGPIEGGIDTARNTQISAYWDVYYNRQHVEGTFDGNSFTGTITFTGSSDGVNFGFADFTADLMLTRTSVSTGSTSVTSARTY